MASLVSNILVLVTFAPKGNPITVHTLTSVPFNKSLASGTQVGLMQTEAK
jgi:hypothetical protein